MCSEEDPARCHRHLLIGRVLRERGVSFLHIRGDGRLQPDEELTAAEGPAPAQTALFMEESRPRPWRSLRSVSRRRTPLTSSGH
jgi:hypothetical protein